MYTVVARFHHSSRDLDEIGRKLEASGVNDAVITRFTVVMSFEYGSTTNAEKTARQVLDRIGATRIKITRRGPKPVSSAD